MKLSYNWVKRYWNMDGIGPEEYIRRFNETGLTLEDTVYLKVEDGNVSADNIVWDIDIPEYRDDLLCMMWNSKESCGLFHRMYYDYCLYGKAAPDYGWVKDVINERHKLFLSLTLHSRTDKCMYILGQYIGNVNPEGKVHDFIHDEVVALGYESEDLFHDLELFCGRNMGQPVWILDARGIVDKQLCIEEAKEAGTIAYQGREYAYDKGDLVFTTGDRVISICGIMLDDSVIPGKDTSSVVVMSAEIDKETVRNTVRKLGIESFNAKLMSIGSNPKSIEKTVGNVTSYLYECAGARLIEGETVMCKRDLQRRYIKVSVEEINSILDSDFTYQEIKDSLENAEVLAFDPDEEENVFYIKLTSYNRDEYACDIAQRLINYYGYDRIGVRK